MTNKKCSLWRDIQDIIGPASHWPKRMRTLFWSKNIKHFDRIILATFVYVNGLNPYIFLKWVDLSHMCRDAAARRHLSSLLDMFECGRYYKLYGYNVLMRRTEWLDGNLK
jgi:hypothetical protein